MTDDELTAGAAELAERILEEVSRPVQNWCNIAALARELAALADGAARHRRVEDAKIPLPADPRRPGHLASSFRGLAHPTRLQILAALQGEAVLSPTGLLDRI